MPEKLPPKQEDIAIVSFRKLRQCIGMLGILLPIIIVIHTLVFSDCCCLQDSISHYYYTVAGVWFVGILWALGLTLIFYPTPRIESLDNRPSRNVIGFCNRCKPKLDGPLTSLSGIFAICVSLFPTDANSVGGCTLFKYVDSDLREGVHYACAAAMLTIFSYMSVCVFTRTTKDDLSLPEHRWKWWRNLVYIGCGLLTFLSILSVAVLALLANFANVTVHPKSTFWLEVTALVPFGISWLIKGGFILVDDGDKSSIAKLKFW